MNIIHFETIDSTNTYAKQNLAELEDKTVISADFQTAGRGRFTRSWVNLGSENIYATFVLKPSETMSPVFANLTQYLSVVICRQMEELGLNPRIKWPNDIQIKGKKAVGILCESVIKGGKLKGLALGVGINLNAQLNELEKIDRPATALNLILGYTIEKEEFLEKLVKNFFEDYETFLETGFSSIREEYKKRANFLNQNLTLAIFDKTLRGFCKDVDDFGNIVIETESGEIKSINMGEIV